MYRTFHLSELQHKLATSGDQLAYKELFLRFQPYLKKFASSIVHSAESAEEIVSDVFIKVWENRKTLDQVHNLKFYLYVSTKNVAINYLRRHHKVESLQLANLDVQLTSLEQDPHQLMMTSEMLQTIKEAIDTLPPKCKIIFKLIKEDGLRQKEVAELLHISPRTVENQLAIAVRKIGQVLPVSVGNSVYL